MGNFCNTTILMPYLLQHAELLCVGMVIPFSPLKQTRLMQYFAFSVMLSNIRDYVQYTKVIVVLSGNYRSTHKTSIF